MMNSAETKEKDRALAQRCLDCAVCKKARRDQKRLAFHFVKAISRNICPCCRAYENVHGKKVHEPAGVDPMGT